jgi:hypothetical protein
MIVYNVTTKVNRSIAESWLAWHTTKHIPETIATGLFDDFSIYRLLEQDDADGPTFITQYFTTTVERYIQYRDEFLQQEEEQAYSKWGDGLASFRTIMQSVR